MKLAQFAQTEQNLDSEAFVAKFNHSFLLINRAPGENVNDAAPGFHTKAADQARQSLLQALDEAELYFVSSDGARLCSKITVGRTPNTDITFDHSAISKFHAYFQVNKDGSCSVCDPGSTNGTVLNGVPLGKHQPVQVRGGETIVFGDVFETTYHTAQTLYRHMQMLRQWSKR